MIFRSTRGQAPEMDLSGAVIQGIAPDKGLYVPVEFPKLEKDWADYAAMDYKTLAAEVLRPYAGEFTEEELKACIDGAYTDKFEAEDVVPLVHAGGADFLDLLPSPQQNAEACFLLNDQVLPCHLRHRLRKALHIQFFRFDLCRRVGDPRLFSDLFQPFNS